MKDLIERRAAIDAIDSVLVEDESCKVWFKLAVKNLPSAQPERKTGKWIDGKVKHIKNGELRNVRECSECGSSYFVYDNYNSVDEIPNYCPNCGADMREVSE